jgi:DNA sulfur modification protein DndD
MIIKSISLENFQCYAGSLSENRIEFKEGLNVVIGDNGSGKSKLYDAFYWVLHDKIFDSALRDFRRTEQVGENLISDKARFECQEGESISAKVQLELYETSEISGENTYLLERTYTIHLASSNGKKEWIKSQKSELYVYNKTITEFKPVTDRDRIDLILKKFLPDDIKPYLWFQGEQVDSLIDFQDKDTLSKAINALSDISTFDDYVEIAEKAANQAKRFYEKEQKKLSSDQALYDQLLEAKRKDEENLKRAEKELLIVQQNLGLAEEDEQQLLNKVDDAENVSKLKTKKARLEEQYKLKKETLLNLEKGFNNNLFSKDWVLRNSLNFFKEYEVKKRNYEIKRENIITDRKSELKLEKAREYKLPVNVPNRKILEEMLEGNWCYVCSHNFEHDHSAKDYVRSQIERAKETKVETPVTKHNFKDCYQLLYNVGYSKEKVIANIDTSISTEIQNRSKLKSEIEDLEKQVSEIESELNVTLSSSSFNLGESEGIVHKFNAIRKNREGLKEEERKLQLKIQGCSARIQESENKLGSLVTVSMDPKVESKKQAFENFYKIAVSTKKRVYQEQIERIEEEANKHFRSMTDDNKSVRGRIRLKQLPSGTYMPQIVNDQGIELSSINDSNIILVKLAVIMAIVSAKGRSSEFYPLISDAPTSKFSDNYTIGFCQAVSKVFKQSIIMSYDFYHNLPLRKRLLSEVANKGSIYIVEPNVQERNRENRNALETKVQALN